jgi:ferritin-like metal-binding protein YciE
MRGIMQKDLKDLLIDELHDILSSEEQIIEALPEMVKASESPDLKNAFESHLKETKEQVRRLVKVFKLLKIKKEEKFCKATKGLIQECKEVLKDFKTKSSIRDAALISKAQRIEHYEISAYGTVRTYAKELGLGEVANLLQDTLDEEGNADKKLTKIAEGGFFKTGINLQANQPKDEVKNSVKTKPKKATNATKAKKVTSKRKTSSAKANLKKKK